MKKNFFLSTLLLSLLFILPVRSKGQFFVQGFTIGPGLGCDAAVTTSLGEVDLVIPPEITFAQLDHLSTKFFTDANMVNIAISVYVSGPFQIRFLYQASVTPNTWQETGNLIYPLSPIDVDYDNFYGYSYMDLIPWGFGNLEVENVRISISAPGASVTKIDESRVNNVFLNYDDCDNDNMLDYFDCAPSVPQGEKTKICHNGNTICISLSAVSAHQAHGDYLGPCIQPVAIASLPAEEEKRKPGFAVYPTAATSQVTIRDHEHRSLGMVRIYDVSGKLVYERSIGDSQAVLDVQKFRPGIYYVRSDQHSATARFIKL